MQRKLNLNGAVMDLIISAGLRVALGSDWSMHTTLASDWMMQSTVAIIHISGSYRSSKISLLFQKHSSSFFASVITKCTASHRMLPVSDKM